MVGGSNEVRRERRGDADLDLEMVGWVAGTISSIATVIASQNRTGKWIARAVSARDIFILLLGAGMDFGRLDCHVFQ